MANYIIGYEFTIAVKGMDHDYLSSARSSLGFKASNDSSEEELIEEAKNIIEEVKSGWRFLYVMEA